MTTTEIRQTKSQIGFEFEFIRDSEYNLGEIKKSLRKLFKVDIKIEKEHHSDFIPTDTSWKIEPDYSGGKNLVELVTGPLPYPQARIVLLQMLKWIREDDKISLDRKCSLHINVNVTGPYVQNVDILKYILHFDEALVYKYFPDRERNIYAKTIKAVYPRHSTFKLDDLILSKTNYVYPSNKYYGINFTKLAKGYLEFRYLGGASYAKRSNECLELMNYFIDSLIDCYKNPYTKNDIVHLKEIVAKKNSLFMANQSYFNFKHIFKNLKLMVDGDDNPESIKSQFHKIVQVLFPLFQKMEVINYNLKGVVNYDSDESYVEIAGVKLKDTVIDSLRVIIINSELIECVVDNVNLKDCKTNTCDLTNTDTDGCHLTKTRIKYGYHQDNEITGGYINGKFIIIDRCVINGDTIFREGKYRDTEISDSVEIIDAEEIKNNED
jgi:hypothetical protein